MAAEQSATTAPPLAGPADDGGPEIPETDVGESMDSLRTCMKDMARTLTNIDAAFDNDAEEDPMLLRVVTHEMTQVREALQRMSLQILACYAPQPTEDPIPPDATEETKRQIVAQNHLRAIQHAALQSAAQEAWKKNGYDALVVQTV